LTYEKHGPEIVSISSGKTKTRFGQEFFRLTYIILRKEIADLFRSKNLLAMLLLQPIITTMALGVSANFTFSRLSETLFNLPIPGPIGEISYLEFMAPATIPLMMIWTTMALSSVSIVGEKTRGTFDRLLATKISETSIILGKIFANALVSLIQAAIILIIIFSYGVKSEGSIILLFLLEILVGIIGLSLGTLYSVLSSSEVQAFQFITPSIMPQIILCGFTWPREAMKGLPLIISNYLPLTYANDAFRKVMNEGEGLRGIQSEVLTLIVFSFFFIACTILVLKIDPATKIKKLFGKG
jgi:ABC-2 type transport system permease protein